MSYNGSGTFNINSAGQPVVTGTVISSTAFNALTADLGTGLSTAITKDGQTVATARIPFAAGINSSLVTDATNTTTGSIITAGGVGIAKALFVGTTLNVAGASTLAAITGTFNGTVGATTPAAGAFTMLTMNGATATGLSAGEIGFTNSAALRWRNGANSGYINCMYLNGTNDLIFGGSAATTILSQITGVGTVTTVSSTGLAVTGTLTSTLDATHYGVTVGRGAGAVSTNTAVGASALAGNTTGSNNVAVGQIALDVNTTGEANTAVGVNSLGANIAGSDNTAVGVSALSFNTSGASNTALGRGALTLNTTASNNTAVGYQAGYSNIVGAYNTLVGYQAGYSMAGSGNTLNTFIGQSAGYNVTTGTKNTIIGTYNGNQGSLDIRGASNYIVLSDGDGNPRGIFDSSGNLLVGTTATVNAAKSYFAFTSANNGVYIADTTGVNNAQFMRFDTAASVVCGQITRVGTTSAVVYTATSDYRLKTVTGAVTGQGARIDALKPIDYQWKENNSQARGFLAHEFQTVYPNSVSGEKDAEDEDGNPVYQAMQASTSEVIADLVAEIQSLRKRITALENK